MSVINTNTIALNAQRNLATNSASLSTTIQRLSSGLRINSAKDDAAGLAISQRFTTQIRGMDQAARNANDGISLAQTAEGALGEIGNNLQRIRELAVQSRNATNSDSDRAALNAEVGQLKAEIQRVAEQTSFNGLKLLDGSFKNQAFQVGANQGQVINIAQIANASRDQLGSWTSVATPASASGIAAVGSTTGGTTTPGTATLDVSAFAATDGSDGFDAFDIEVNGQVVTVAAASGGADIDANRATLAANIAAAVNGEASGVASATGTTVSFSNSGASAVSIVDTDSALGGDITVAAQTTSGGSTTFAAGSFDLTGAAGTATISFAAAGSASERASALVTAINNETGNTGVTASLVDGKLALSSATGDITIANADVAETGLTDGTTSNYSAGSAQVGFENLDISSTAGADNAILAMDAALDAVNSSRAELGAIQNRFSSVVANLQTTSENLTASRSRIMDTDFAKETAELSRTQILQQAGTAMLAQANQIPQNVLSLLR
jgi:flagellin